MVDLNLTIVRTQVLSRTSGTDKIFLFMGEEESQELFGENFQWMGEASMVLDCPRGSHEHVLRTLGIKHFELVDTDSGTRTEATIE